METLPQALRHAFRLIFTLDSEMLRAVLVSLEVSLPALLIAAVLGIPLALLLSHTHLPGRGAARVLFRSLMAVPTVVIGLVLFSFLSRAGPLGGLGLLFKPLAMTIGQAVLALPIVVCLVDTAVESVDPRVEQTALTLGASTFGAARAVLHEARHGVALALVTAFGRVFSEIGISMMLGGNITGYTRNITTGIALETGKGELALGLALGLILLLVAMSLTTCAHLLERRKRSWRS